MQRITQFYMEKLSGLLAAIVIAIAAMFLSEHYGAPTMLFALLLGIAMNFLSADERCKGGIDLAAKQILRFGVALLGLRISFEAVSKLGIGPVILVVVGVLSTILVGVLLTRSEKSNWVFGCLSGGSVAICGASAAMALSSVLPHHKDHERDTIFTVITITAFSTTAMIVYPIVAGMFGLDEQQTGIFLGATIHDVAQVVGAGYSVSDAAGDTATIVKLLRVAMLLPVVLSVMMFVRLRFKNEGEQHAKLPFPWFVLGFVVLVGANSTIDIPPAVSGFFNDLSRWCIVTAVAALGMKTSFGALVKVGWFPVAVIFGETLFLLILALASISLFGL